LSNIYHHEIDGKKVKAFVVSRNGESIEAEALNEYCDGKLAAYKIPKEYEFIEALPRNAAGKVLRRELRPKN
jgi:long-chain acyl-CoA synthetase